MLPNNLKQILFLFILTSNNCLFGQYIPFQLTKNNLNISEVKLNEDMFDDYSLSYQKAFLSVLKYNQKVIDIQVIPKRVYDKNYQFIDLTHFIDKSVFSKEDQLTLLTKYKNECGFISKGDRIAIKLTNPNNLVRFTDDIPKDKSNEHESFFSFSRGILPNFLKHSIVLIDFIHSESISQINRDTFFNVTPQISEVDISSCKQSSCQFERDPLSIFISVVQNTKGEIIDITSIDYDLFQFEFNRIKKFRFPIQLDHWLPKKYFNTDESLSFLTEYRCNDNNKYFYTILNVKWDQLQNRISKMMCNYNNLPFFLKHSFLKIQF